MKTFFTILLGMLYLSVFGQIKPLVITQKQVQNTIVLSVSNTTPQEYAFTLSLTLTGLTADRPIPVIGQVTGGEEKEVVVLTALSGQQPHFKYKLTPELLFPVEEEVLGSNEINSKGLRVVVANSAKHHAEKARRNVKSKLDPEVLGVFTKIDCSRCDLSIDFLKKNNVKFKEYNTSQSLKYEELMWDALYIFGQKEGKVSMPVFVYDSKVYYSVEDLESFLYGLVGK
jgi:glutaredoxin